MIKKLDKVILKTFIGPFVGTFFVVLFVLLMQIIWKYIDDLVGKGLDLLTIFRFVIYASATMVTLALPIAILLSAIMTFGQLGENYELVAIKSAGISLLRFMRPLLFVALLLCSITFLFANYIIPVANLKFEMLWNDIYHKSPAFDLKEGVFYNGFQGYSIKIAKKEKDKTTLRNVLIYEKAYGPQDNTIISQSGVMKISPDKKYLQFTLLNGNRYEEKGDNFNPNNTEYIRLSFKEYNKIFDLSQLDIKATADSVYKNASGMLNIKQLNKALDSIGKIPVALKKRGANEMYSYFNYLSLKSSLQNNPKPVKVKSFDDLIPDSIKPFVHQSSNLSAGVLQSNYSYTFKEYETQDRIITGHLTEWHKKFSLSAACLILFFIGAPLGAIIRKGGLGVPIFVAIIFFVIFHLLNVFGEKLANENVLTPLVGMWLSIFVLTPLGIFLTYKASIDSKILNREFYVRAFRPLVSIFKNKK